MTMGLPPLPSGFDARKAALSLLVGFATAVASGGAGFSASTSAAGLSSRNPLKAACRTKPAPVQPANSISATSSGLVQFTFASLRGAPIPVNGDLAVVTAFRRGRSCLTLASLYPVPTRPT